MKILDLGSDNYNKVKIDDIKSYLKKYFPKSRIKIPDGSHEIVSLGLDSCDININIENKKIPLSDKSVDLIWSRGFFEHISRGPGIFHVLEECWRILKPNGILIINVPHFSSAGAHYVLDHKSEWGYSSMSAWLTGEYRFHVTYLCKAVFKRLGTNLLFLKPCRYTGLAWLFNKFPILYERFFCWMFPAYEINFLLQKVEKWKK